MLQDAAADGAGHIQQLVLPDEPELCLVLIREADRQLRGLERVAEACGLDAEVQHFAVRQDEDLLPGAGNTLHIHQKDAVRGKDRLVAHGLVRAHDGLAVQQKRLHILADLLLLDANEVLHGLVPKFHSSIPFQRGRWFHCSTPGGL